MRLEAALAERRRKAEEEAKEAERIKTEQKRSQVWIDTLFLSRYYSLCSITRLILCCIKLFSN